MHTPLSVIFIWHMHQPYYKDPLRGEYALPWTYLHGIKDYYDMAAIVAETPGAKAVFNLVPSLIEQLLDYASGNAVDPFLEKGMAAPADASPQVAATPCDLACLGAGVGRLCLTWRLSTPLAAKRFGRAMTCDALNASLEGPTARPSARRPDSQVDRPRPVASAS